MNFNLGILNVYFTSDDGIAPVALPNFLYVAKIHLFLTTIAMIVVSLMTDPPSSESLESMVWTKQEFTKETESLSGLAWYKNYRYQGLALMFLVIIILLWFA